MNGYAELARDCSSMMEFMEKSGAFWTRLEIANLNGHWQCDLVAFWTLNRDAGMRRVQSSTKEDRAAGLIHKTADAAMGALLVRIQEMSDDPSDYQNQDGMWKSLHAKTVLIGTITQEGDFVSSDVGDEPEC